MINYKVREITLFGETEEERQKRYMAVAVGMQVHDLERVARTIAHNSSFTTGDVYGVLRNFVAEMQNVLEDGNVLRLGEIGDFYLSVTSDLFEKPTDVTPRHVRVKKVVYRPSEEFKDRMKLAEFGSLGKAVGRRKPKDKEENVQK